MPKQKSDAIPEERPEPEEQKEDIVPVQEKAPV